MTQRKPEQEPEQTNQMPMTPDYMDMILGELMAIRVILEKKMKD